MTSIRVFYCFEDEEKHVMKVKNDYTVGDFLDRARKELDNDDINCVYLNRNLLDNESKIVDCSKDLEKDIFIVSDNLYKTFTVKFNTVKCCFKGDDTIHKIIVEQNCIIANLIDYIREELKNDDINCVFLNGRLIDKEELITNVVNDFKTDIFVASDDESEVPPLPPVDDEPLSIKIPSKKPHKKKQGDDDSPSEKPHKEEPGDDDSPSKKPHKEEPGDDDSPSKKPHKKEPGDVDEPLTKTPEEDEEEEDSIPTPIHDNEFEIFTTATIKSFFDGNKVEIDLNDNYTEVSNKIRKIIDDLDVHDLPDDYEIHIFLPGGVPFLPGKNPEKTKLKPYFNIKRSMRHRLYVVITKKLDDFIDHDVDEPCNCTKDYRDMLSPLYESTIAGLTQIASLLGYFYHGGVNGEHLLLVLAKFTKFPPLVVNIYRLMEQEKLNVRNIIAITGPFFTIFKYLLQDIENKKVFEYTIKTISYLGMIDNNKFLDLQAFDLKDGGDDDDDECNEEEIDFIEYFKKTKQQKHIVIWRMDIDSKKFTRCTFDLPEKEVLTGDDLFDAIRTFKPIAPLSLRFVHYPTFVKSDKHNEVFLFINEDLNKEDTINIIDPKVGKIEQIKIDDLAKKIKNDKKEDYLSLIDDNCVDQIIVICFDESLSMKWTHEGRPNRNEKELSRYKIGTKFLKALVNQTTKLRVSSIYGLISFNNEIHERQKITAMSSKFIEGLEKIKPYESTLLYDALQKAQEMIVELTEPIPNDDGEEDTQPYQNAKLRIIVISDGVDNGSKTSPIQLANTLVESGIVVDTVIISRFDRNDGMCALSKITGGLCFYPKDINEGIKIFEQEAFLNINMRRVDRPYNKRVTPKIFDEFKEKFIKNAKYDKEAENIEIKKFNVKIPLAIPLYMNYLYKNQRKIQSIRIHRALKELNIIGYNPSENYVVLSSYSTPSEWRVFIKGPKGTPFENKWFNVFMTLSSSYPAKPPSFRFLTIPFHPNISQEGTLLFSLINKGYSPKLGIDSIIDGIVKLIEKPELQLAINSEALKLYNDDKKAYKEKQSSLHLKSDYKKYLDDVKIYDEIPKDEYIPISQRESQFYVTLRDDTSGRILSVSSGSDLYLT